MRPRLLGQVPLTVRLREATSELHRRCERVVDVPGRASTLEDYRRLLDHFLAFHRSVVPAIGDVTAAAPLDLTGRLHARGARCRADLDALGGADRPVRGPVALGGLTGLARQLGAWYVIEGSALGGTVIARHVRRSLPAAAGALRFLSGDGSSAASNWREFQRFAEGCESDLELEFLEVAAGAELAFHHFIAIAVTSS